jgi:hypothetical protein
MDRHDRIGLIVLSGEQGPYLYVTRFLLELLNLRFEIGEDIFSLKGQFQQCPEVGQFPGQPGIEFDILLQPAPHLKHGLRLLLTIPEFGQGYLFLELENLRAFAFRIKDNLESDAPSNRSRSLSRAVLRALKPPENWTLILSLSS